MFLYTILFYSFIILNKAQYGGIMSTATCCSTDSGVIFTPPVSLQPVPLVPFLYGELSRSPVFVFCLPPPPAAFPTGDFSL